MEPTLVHPRFPLAITVMVREGSSGAAVLAQLKNISLSGCYLHTPRQVAEGERVRVVLQTADVRAELSGIVKRRDQDGIGIQFTNGATVEDWKRLENFITKLQAEKPPAKAATSASQ